MPRKDGTPTKAERMKADRIEANRRYVLDGKDLSEVTFYSLQDIREELADTPEAVALIDAELERRRHDREYLGRSES